MIEKKHKKYLWEYKLDLLYYGISISNACYHTLRKGVNNKITSNDYITTKGLMVVLNSEVYVNADINEASSYQLDFKDGKYILKCESSLICEVDIIQPPEFALKFQKLTNGEFINRFVNIHGDRIRVQPIEGCAYRCTFCSLNSFKYKLNDLNNLDEAFQYALKNVPFRHALISGGSPINKQNDYDYLNNVYEFFGKKYGSEIPMDIMLVPRGLYVDRNNIQGYEEFLKKLKDWNISGLAINLELYNDEYRKKYIPNKDSIGKKNYFKFIELAVKIFGIGNVRSCIIIGLEEMEDSLIAVEKLAQIGCMPVLSPYIPNDNKTFKPKPQFMKDVLLSAQKIIDNYNIELGSKCNSCKHNTIHFR